jgi:hypothetical protein
MSLFLTTIHTRIVLSKKVRGDTIKEKLENSKEVRLACGQRGKDSEKDLLMCFEEERETVQIMVRDDTANNDEVSAMLGYIVTGVSLGPFGIEWIADCDRSSTLARYVLADNIARSLSEKLPSRCEKCDIVLTYRVDIWEVGQYWNKVMYTEDIGMDDELIRDLLWFVKKYHPSCAV